MNIGEEKFINILFVTRQNFLQNVKSGGHKMSKNIFHCFNDNDDLEVILCILDISKYENDDSDKVKIIHIKDNPIKRNLSYLFLGSGYSWSENNVLSNFISMNKADVVIFDGTWFGRHIKAVNMQQKTVVFCHNVEKEFAMNRIKVTRKISSIPRFFSDWYNEKCVIKKADKVICLNERDNRLLYKNYSRSADLIIPIVLEDTYVENNKEDGRSNKILFVGSSFYPNIEGIRWFCRNVMPYVDCKLDIVGKGMEILRDELESDNIKVVGTVDSLRRYYDEADLVVLPLFSGGGMKVKMAEAMMYGKKIVATDEALEGYQVESTNDIIRCNTAERFITVINSIMGDKEFKKFSEANRNLFLKYYSIFSMRKKIYDLLGELMNEGDRVSV